MKIIDAVWEKRNLGVDTMEFEIDADDNAQEVKKILSENEKDYNVVKVISGRPDLNFLVQQLGYTYIETSFNLVFDLKKQAVNLSPIQKRMSDCVAYAMMDDHDLEELFEELRKGMFTTDRIAVNPAFGVEIANKRYINWIRDERKRGTGIFKMTYKGYSIGFFVLRELGQDIYNSMLVGMYEKYFKSGLGINTVVKPVEEGIKRNGRYIASYVVSNNFRALDTCLSMGTKIHHFYTVFDKLKK